jgi:hypothetical protein
VLANHLALNGRHVPAEQLKHYRLRWELDDFCSYAERAEAAGLCTNCPVILP